MRPTIAISHGRQYVVALPCPLSEGRNAFNLSSLSRHRGHEVCRLGVAAHAPMPATAGNWNDQPCKRHHSPRLVQQGRGKGHRNVNLAVGH
jgi:hypothetical protein